MNRYRKIQDVYTCRQLSTHNTIELIKWIGFGRASDDFMNQELRIKTPEKTIVAKNTDWVIKDRGDNISVCSDEVFKKVYERA